jgi:hypothetical protein
MFPSFRGESRYIVVSRALVLSCIALGVPAFGIYATVIMPLNSVVSTRTIRNPLWDGTKRVGRQNNATIMWLLKFLWTISFYSRRHQTSVSAEEIVGQMNVHNCTLFNPSLIGCPGSGGFFTCMSTASLSLSCSKLQAHAEGLISTESLLALLSHPGQTRPTSTSGATWGCAMDFRSLSLSSLDPASLDYCAGLYDKRLRFQTQYIMGSMTFYVPANPH